MACESLLNLREQIHILWHEFLTNKTWFLHHYNALIHMAHLTRDYLIKSNVHVIPQALYSPAMAPCDFFLFPKLELSLRGKYFETIEAIKEQRKLKAIPKKAYEKYYKAGENVDIWWDYIEGDKINIGK